MTKTIAKEFFDVMQQHDKVIHNKNESALFCTALSIQKGRFRSLEKARRRGHKNSPGVLPPASIFLSLP